MADSSPPNERRSEERRLACFPGAVERPDGPARPCVIHDLSESGALLLTRTPSIAVGDEVMLQLYIFDDTNEFQPAAARVVRIEDALGEAGPWLQRVAVQFTEPLTMYTEEIQRFQELARRLGMT